MTSLLFQRRSKFRAISDGKLTDRRGNVGQKSSRLRFLSEIVRPENDFTLCVPERLRRLWLHARGTVSAFRRHLPVTAAEQQQPHRPSITARPRRRSNMPRLLPRGTKGGVDGGVGGWPEGPGVGDHGPVSR